MNNQAGRWVGAMALGIAALSAAQAEVKVARVFSDHMVLQQQMPIMVWGWAEPGEDVRVTLAGKSVAAKAKADRSWSVELPAMKADGKPYVMTVKGSKNEIAFSDVLLGEVWLASGQSNMGRSIKITETSPNVRVFWRRLEEKLIPRKDDFGPGDKVGWCPAVPQTMLSTIPAITVPKKEAGDVFGEVAYVFARRLNTDLKIPVGIFHIAWGGTTAGAWTPREGIEKEFPFEKAPENQKLSHTDGAMYQTQLRPIVPFTIRGVIWYQGEDDGRSLDYDKSLTGLINSWRKLWNQPDMPFYFVQIAPTGYANGMLAVWESQVKVMHSLTNTALAVSNDIYEGYKGNKNEEVRMHTANNQEAAINWPISGGGNPHPPNKQLVAERLASIALVKLYNKPDRPLYGPMYDSHVIAGDKVTVRFKYAYEGLKSFDGKDLTWFELSDGTLDGKKKLTYVKAQARIIRKDIVEVWSDEVKQPKFVRFSWHQLARNNLINSGRLPAVAFRTDTQRDPHVR